MAGSDSKPRRRAPRKRTRGRADEPDPADVAVAAARTRSPDALAATAAARPDHPTLDDDEPVWRYVHMPKLVDLLVRRQLPLVRVDLLGDRFEGSLPHGQADWLHEALARAHAEDADAARLQREPATDDASRARAAQLRRSLVRYTHASCWRAGRDESAAMWRTYCGPDEGAAIRTTYGRLKQAIQDEGTVVAPVHYLDFETQRLPTHDLAYPLLCKRVEFAHEREVRVLRFRIDGWLRALEEAPPSAVAAHPVEYLPFDPEAALEAIYVSPYAAQWYFDAVRVLVEKLAPPLGERVRWSRLAADPDWA